MPMPMPCTEQIQLSFRTRVRYLVLAIGTIAVGLMVHLGGSLLSPVLRDVLGDALWAMMMVWWMGVAAPRLPLRTRGLAALAVCISVELSQRYHTPFLDALRRTVPGHLVLGSGYDPRDLLAYTAGVIIAVVLAHMIRE
jgi:Protein of unknown function (DUF2809)